MDTRISRIVSISISALVLLALFAISLAPLAIKSSDVLRKTRHLIQRGFIASLDHPITIRIGSDFPTSGADISFGMAAQNGVELAIRQANKQKLVPGVQFQFVPKDDVYPNGAHGAMGGGQGNMIELIGDASVAGIVGPLNSSVAIGELPITNESSIAQISPANTNDCLPREEPVEWCGGDKSRIAALRPTGKINYFRIAPTDAFEGPALADFAYNTLKFKKVYVIDDTQTFGGIVADSFMTAWQQLGGVVLEHKHMPPTMTSFADVLDDIASKHPDFVFFGGNDSTGGIPLRQQMLQVPALQDMVLMGGDGLKTNIFARFIGRTGGKVYTVVPGPDTLAVDTPLSRSFFTAYADAFGGDHIGFYSAPAYDCAMILMQAIGRALRHGAIPPTASNDAGTAKVFRQAVIEEMKATDYEGLTGHQTFDANGDTNHRVFGIYEIGTDMQIRDGWDYVTDEHIDG